MSPGAVRHEAFVQGMMTPSAGVRVGDHLRISCEVMDRFHEVIHHPHELLVRKRQMHALRHKVIDGPCSIAQTKQKNYRAFQAWYAGESSSPANCVITLANEKER
jgi:hypothetical protein